MQSQIRFIVKYFKARQAIMTSFVYFLQMQTYSGCETVDFLTMRTYSGCGALDFLTMQTYVTSVTLYGFDASSTDLVDVSDYTVQVTAKL